MIIGPDFIWLHFPKCAGTFTENLLRKVIPNEDNRLQFDPIDPENVIWHHNIKQRENYIGNTISDRIIICNFRRLPDWIISRIKYEQNRSGQIVTKDMYIKGAFYEQNGNINSAERVLKKYSEPTVTHWLRVEHLQYDFSRVFAKYLNLEQVNYSGYFQIKINTSGWDGDFHNWFSPEDLDVLYASCPSWCLLEYKLYGNIMANMDDTRITEILNEKSPGDSMKPGFSLLYNSPNHPGQTNNSPEQASFPGEFANTIPIWNEKPKKCKPSAIEFNPEDPIQDQPFDSNPVHHISAVQSPGGSENHFLPAARCSINSGTKNIGTGDQSILGRNDSMALTYIPGKQNLRIEHPLQSNDSMDSGHFKVLDLAKIISGNLICNQISDLVVTEKGLSFTSSGNDPYLFLSNDLKFENIKIIRIDITLPVATILEVFHKAVNISNFNKSDSQRKQLPAKRSLATFIFPNEGISGNIRIDPGCHPGDYIIHKIEID